MMKVHNKTLRTALPLLLSGVMVAGMAIGYLLKTRAGTGGPLMGNQRPSTLQEVMSLVRQDYVDAGRLDSVEQRVVEDLLARLDPHSLFVPKAEAADLISDLQGQFGGVGIEYHLLNDTATVVAVLAKGPAHKAGIKPGDQLLGVVGEKPFAADSTLTTSVRQALRGKPGSMVKVQVKRNGQPLQISLVRAIIPLPAVSAAYMVNDTTGYIGLTKFSQTAYPEFMQRLEGLQKGKKLRHLILDLRGNGGGLLQAAVNIADEFLSENKLVTYTEGARSPRTDYRCKRPGLYEEGKLTVLIDEGSASASEIVAGALQDWDRARLVGRRSFGKGLVQQQYTLSSGDELRLTVARYYTPLGRDIQKSYAQGPEAYKAEVGQRGNDSSYIKDSALHSRRFRTPAGRILFSHGGISPDVVVASDSGQMVSAGWLRLFRKGLPTQVALQVLREQATLLQPLTNASSMAQQAALRTLLMALLRKQGGADFGGLTTVQQQKLLEQTLVQLAKMKLGSEAAVELRNRLQPAWTVAL